VQRKQRVDELSGIPINVSNTVTLFLRRFYPFNELKGFLSKLDPSSLQFLRMEQKQQSSPLIKDKLITVKQFNNLYHFTVIN
jgi:hypothetical protein